LHGKQRFHGKADRLAAVRFSALLVLLLLAGLAFVQVGCGDDGGEDSDEEEVRRVAQAYVDALAANDAAAACEYLPDDGSCEATEAEIRQGDDPLGGDFGQVKTVRISGEAARADFSSGGFLVLSKSGEGWKIGAPASEAADLGAPKPPKTEPCSPQQEKKLREQNKKLGIPVDDGPLFCVKGSAADK
jgi:hypothetical protein